MTSPIVQDLQPVWGPCSLAIVCDMLGAEQQTDLGFTVDHVESFYEQISLFINRIEQHLRHFLVRANIELMDRQHTNTHTEKEDGAERTVLYQSHRNIESRNRWLSTVYKCVYQAKKIKVVFRYPDRP